jgi:hypothetical protein
MCGVMAFGRRKSNNDDDSDAVDDRDPFAHLAEDRRAAEAGSPWFLAPDEGPALQVETGISSNLSADDLGGRREGDDLDVRDEDEPSGDGPAT